MRLRMECRGFRQSLLFRARRGHIRDDMHHPDPHLHEVVLALFKYGLASEAQDVAIVMGISDDEARRVCDDLVAAGLLAAE